MLMVLILAGCLKNDPMPSPEPLEIFPLSTGNQWHFRTTESNQQTTFHINEVAGDTLINGQRWFILTYDTTVKTTCRNTLAGWWFLYQPSPGAPVTQELYYRYPALVGERYMTGDSTLVTVTAIYEAITVPAGTFFCYHYHMVHNLENYECEEYFSPGVGFIKHVIYAPGSGSMRIASVTELIEYHLSGTR